MITSNVAFYPVADLKATVDFYKDIIGLKIVFSSETQVIFCANKGHFGFVEYEDKKAAEGRLCLSLNCGSNEEVDEEYKRVCALGATPLAAPAMHPKFPIYSFFIKDPNGYFAEFQKLQGYDL